MYRIYADDICIYDAMSPLEEIKLVEPKLSMAENSAGSLVFTMPAKNAGYDVVQRLSSHVTVEKDGNEIWSGRVINEEKDFWNNRKITCEGELAYLNDTAQPQHEYHIEGANGVDAVEMFLRELIRIHNEKATNDMQFEVGMVTVTDPNNYIYKYTNYESTLECIKEKLIDTYGGRLRIRKVNGVRKLDYLADYVTTNTQTIEFGKNLLDFTKSWDLTELATVITPLGKPLEEDASAEEGSSEQSSEVLQKYLTVETADPMDDPETGISHEAESMYVKSNNAISTYGWIEAVVHWDDVTVANNLMNKAKDYLAEAQFEKMELELNAVDLHDLNPSIEGFNLLDEVVCISPPHGMNKKFPVTKVEIPLDKPEETTYTMGTSVKSTMSAKVREGTKELMQKVEESTYSVLTRAKQRAAEMINSRTRGYITITEDPQNGGSNELIISEMKDLDNPENLHMWVWNMAGLGYTKDGRKTFDVAITMTGQIVADFITTGTLDADRVNVINLNAQSIVAGLLKDKNNNNHWNLDTGEFKLSANTQVGDSTIASDADVSSSISSYDNGLDQQKVFNRLTNNGQNSGIYLEGGKLYINADYIQAGTISTNRLKTKNISDLGNATEFESDTYFGEDSTVRIQHRIQIRGVNIDEGESAVQVWDGDKYNNAESGTWEIDGKKYTFAHGILIKRE